MATGQQPGFGGRTLAPLPPQVQLAATEAFAAANGGAAAPTQLAALQALEPTLTLTLTLALALARARALTLTLTLTLTPTLTLTLALTLTLILTRWRPPGAPRRRWRRRPRRPRRHWGDIGRYREI